MSIPGSANALLLASTAAAAGGYQIERSLRFNSSDSAYLSRTPAVAGNRRTWTWAGWVKRSGNFGSNQALLYVTSPNNSAFRFEQPTGNFRIFFNGATDANLETTPIFRDPSAWYHFVFAVDTTQATPANRIKLYVNGSQVTTFSAATYPTQNYESGINSNVAHNIARSPAGGEHFDGYLADVHFIDGQALTPSSFTEVSATTGQLIPKAYAGTYTGNSFWLKFNDNSAATAATLGKDSFLLGNNWTPNNLSVTAGAGNDSLVDTPTSYGTDTGVGGSVRGNYATLNAAGPGASALSEGNLRLDTNSNAVLGTIGVTSGKWYYEGLLQTQVYAQQMFGVVNQNYTESTGQIGISLYGWAILVQSNASNGQPYHNGITGTSLTTFGNGDIVQIAFDVDSGRIWFGRNGTWLGSGNPAAGTNPIYSNLSGTIRPGITNRVDSGGVLQVNFGQRAFAYTAPSGFKALCDTNLPAPLTAKPNTLMDVKLYTGNGSTQTISGLGFSPDLVWTKSRSNGYSHNLQDAVRGFTTGKKLGTNLTFEEGNATELADTNGYISSQTSDGYVISIASGGSGLNMNASGLTYVAWAWDAGTSTVSNTQGSITSQVRANVSAGFSVVTYTYPSSGAFSVGHGLGVTPGLIITKHRNRSSDWAVTHSYLGVQAKNNWLSINTTSATTYAANFWGTEIIDSLTFGGLVGTSGLAGDTDVAYCFAPVVGYSSFGSYTGNGLADGPFVYTGFRPRWVMIKRTDTAAEWIIWDSSRKAYNYQGPFFFAESSAAENSGAEYLDFVSNGFKFRSTNTTINGGTSIYIAFAENPFQYARAR